LQAALADHADKRFGIVNLRAKLLVRISATVEAIAIDAGTADLPGR
jgi:hypothetical protein